MQLNDGVYTHEAAREIDPKTVIGLGIGVISSRLLSRLGQAFPHLEVLVIKDPGFMFSDYMIFDLLHHLPELKTLNIGKPVKTQCASQ